MRFAIIILHVTSWFTQSVYTQEGYITKSTDTLSTYLQFEDSAPLTCLFTYFPPFFIQHGTELKRFIRSKTFREIRQCFGDCRAVDAIYIRAMQMTNGNTAVALLLATIATLDHRMVGIKIPIFQFFFPLSDETENGFDRRIKNLPQKLYYDTPSSAGGDRDKLQHFFGSAFLTFVFESSDAANRFGEFIEEGEDMFIVGGLLDDRDRRANHQGQQFGLALLENNHYVPSGFLKFHVASEKDSIRDLPSSTGVR